MVSIIIVNFCIIDLSVISKIPRQLVPEEILSGFQSQRVNHMKRMIKHECQILKNGKWTLSNVSFVRVNSLDGGRS